MTGKTHAVLGTAAALAVCVPAGVPQLVTVTAFSVLGSLMPDLDLKSSKANKLLNTVVFVWIIVLAAAIFADKIIGFGLNDILISRAQGAASRLKPIGIAAFVLYFALLPFSGHRGFTHSIAALLAAGIFTAAYFSRIAASAFLTGYVFHMLIDLFNKKGEQLLFPLKKRFCLKLCRSDGIVNMILFAVGSAVSIVEIIALLAVFVLRS